MVHLINNTTHFLHVCPNGHSFIREKNIERQKEEKCPADGCGNHLIWSYQITQTIYAERFMFPEKPETPRADIDALISRWRDQALFHHDGGDEKTAAEVSRCAIELERCIRGKIVTWAPEAG